MRITGENLKQCINEAVEFLQSKISAKPDIAIVLGTGLEYSVGYLKTIYIIPYHEIPHFPVTTAPGHNGLFHITSLGSREILVLHGRAHLYEGYTPMEVAFPVWVMKKLGIKVLILTNAAGGITPGLKVGDIVVIRDHINLQGGSPIAGIKVDEFGDRFPSMNDAYSLKLILLIDRIASQEKIPVRKGTYAAVHGPHFETPSEINMLKILGADLVGMSTVPEVITAKHCGIDVLALSVVSNLCKPEHPDKVSAQEVVSSVEKVSSKLGRLLYRLLVEYK